LPTKWKSNICMERDLFSYSDICRFPMRFAEGEFLSTNHKYFVVYRGRYGIAGSPCRLLRGGELVRIYFNLWHDTYRFGTNRKPYISINDSLIGFDKIIKKNRHGIK